MLNKGGVSSHAPGGQLLDADAVCFWQCNNGCHQLKKGRANGVAAEQAVLMPRKERRGRRFSDKFHGVGTVAVGV